MKSNQCCFSKLRVDLICVICTILITLSPLANEKKHASPPFPDIIIFDYFCLNSISDI